MNQRGGDGAFDLEPEPRQRLKTTLTFPPLTHGFSVAKSGQRLLKPTFAESETFNPHFCDDLRRSLGPAKYDLLSKSLKMKKRPVVNDSKAQSTRGPQVRNVGRSQNLYREVWGGAETMPEYDEKTKALKDVPEVRTFNSWFRNYGMPDFNTVPYGTLSWVGDTMRFQNGKRSRVRRLNQGRIME